MHVMFYLIYIFMNGGYLEVLAWDHPKCRYNGFVYAHTLAAEKKIGRYLKEGEVVHHLNKIKSDNSSDNLIVFKTQSDHSFYHNGGILIETDEKFVYKCEPAKRGKKMGTKCPLCGNIKSYNAFLCYDCRYSNRKIDKNKLEKLIPYYTVMEIARILNVTTTGIRKACNRFGFKYTNNIATKNSVPFQMGLDMESSGSNVQLSLFIGM